MAIASVPLNPLSAPQPRPGDSEVRLSRRSSQADAPSALAAVLDQVHLGESGHVSDALAQNIAVERVASRIASDAGPSASSSGRTAQSASLGASADLKDVAAALAQPSGSSLDTSAGATAQRIADFVTGQAFQAFQSAHPEASKADLADFAQKAQSGLAAGLGDARDIFSALQSLTPARSAWLDRVQSLASNRLTAFFGQTAEALAQ